MFISSRLAFRAMIKRKKHTMYSIISIALAVTVVFSTQIISDSITASIKAREELHFGNMDYIYFNETSGSLPISALSTIEGYSNVEHATWRRNANIVVHSDAYPDTPSSNWVIGIPDLPGERYIGSSEVIGSSNGAQSIEEMLFATNVTHPVVISHDVSKNQLLTLGDTIFFVPEDIVALLATASELESISNGSLTRLEVETQILSNKTRFLRFTITGIIDDRSEGIESVSPSRSTSLKGFQPPDSVFYLDAVDMGLYVSNNHTTTCSFFIISSNDLFNSDSLKDVLSSSTGAPIGVVDVRSLVFDVAFLLNILISSILLAVSIVVILFASNLIQTNIKRNLQDNMRDLGVLQANGYPKKVMKTFTLTQTTFYSICGSVIGLFAGLIPPMFVDVGGMTGAVLTATSDTDVTIPMSVSLFSVLIAIGVGFIFPALFTIRPLNEFNKLTIVQLIDPERIPVDDQKVKLTRLRVAILNAILTILGAVMAFYSGASFYATYTNGRFSNPITIMLLLGLGLGLFLLVWCSKSFFSQILAKSVGVSLRPLRRFIGRFGRIAHRMALSNTVRVRQLISMTIMGFAMVTSLAVVTNSIGLNEKYEKRTYIGGDVGIFTVLDSSHLPGIESLPEIDAATIASYILMSNWESNRVVSSLITNMIDDFGGLRDGVTESVNVMVIDPESYLRVNLNDDALFYIQGGDAETIVRGLDDGASVLMEKQFVESRGLHVGSSVLTNVMGFQKSLSISATTNFFPGMPLIPKTDREYSKVRSFIISDTTMQNIIKNFYSNIDIMIKNRSVNVSDYTNETIETNWLGYGSGMFDRASIEASLSSVPSVVKVAPRFSTFIPGTPTLSVVKNQSRVKYLKPGTTPLAGVIDLPNRLFVIDPGKELDVSGELPIVTTEPWIDMVKFSIGGQPASTHNQTTKEILYGYDNFFVWNGPDPSREAMLGNNSVCIVNQYITTYDDLGEPEWTYEMRAGDVITVELPGESADLIQNFTVVGTVDSHLPYYASNTTKRGAVVNPMTANYNFFGSEDTSTPFIDTFDGDGNVFITSYRMLHHIAYLESGLPWGYDPASISNHFYVKVSGDPITAVNSIKSAINAVSNNFSVYAIKSSLSAQSTQIGALLVRTNPAYSEIQAINALRSYYAANNLTWNEGAWRIPSMVGEVEYINSISSVLSILMFSALLVSLLGLVEILADEINSRKREHGIIRVLGYSRKSIPLSILVELLIIGILGSIIGALVGSSTSYIILGGISSSLLKPLYFDIPLLNLVMLGSVFIGVFVAGGLMLSHQIQRRSVIDGLQQIE